MKITLVLILAVLTGLAGTVDPDPTDPQPTSSPLADLKKLCSNEEAELEYERGQFYELTKCLAQVLNATEFRQQILSVGHTSKVDDVVAKVCNKLPEIVECTSHYVSSIGPCMDEKQKNEKELWKNLRQMNMEFACGIGRDHLISKYHRIQRRNPLELEPITVASLTLPRLYDSTITKLSKNPTTTMLPAELSSQINPMTFPLHSLSLDTLIYRNPTLPRSPIAPKAHIIERNHGLTHSKRNEMSLTSKLFATPKHPLWFKSRVAPVRKNLTAPQDSETSKTQTYFRHPIVPHTSSKHNDSIGHRATTPLKHPTVPRILVIGTRTADDSSVTLKHLQFLNFIIPVHLLQLLEFLYA